MVGSTVPHNTILQRVGFGFFPGFVQKLTRGEQPTAADSLTVQWIRTPPPVNATSVW